MGHSSRILWCLGLFLATPALGQGGHVGLARVHMPTAHAAARVAPRNVARFAARPGLSARGVLGRPRLARATTLGSLQRVGLRDGRVPNLGNGFGLFGVGLGLSTAEELAALPAQPSTFETPSEATPAELPRCVRPQIIKIGKGVKRNPKTKVLYGPATGCTP